jgi:polysaccharide export outer membrane protein
VSIFSLETPAGITRLTRTVSHDGNVALPWVGDIPAAGLSAPQLEERIKAAYAGSYLKQPQVTVNVEEYRSVPVVVTGAVDKPGLYFLKANRSSILECLALAGSLKSTAGDDLLILRSPRSEPAAGRAQAGNPERKTAGKAPAAAERETVIVDLKQLIDQGNMLMNLQVRAGDVLIVPARARRYIYVLGYVQRPGAYELEEGIQLDALRAVALGGGPAGIARPSNTYLIRQTPGGQVATPVDLDEVARGRVPPLYLRPGDTLIVGTTTFGRMSQFLAPSMGASLSASASVAQ